MNQEIDHNSESIKSIYHQIQGFFKNPFDYKLSLKSLFWYLIALVSCYLISSLFHGSINIPVNISELPNGAGQFFPFPLPDIIELIFMGPIFTLIYFIIMKIMIKKIKIEKKRDSYISEFLELISILLVGILVAGHFIHVTYNYASHLYDLQFGGYDTSNLFLFLYWSDEWLGHHLIHFAFFFQIILFLIVEYKLNDHKIMSWDEIALSVSLGIGLFILLGWATYEGQCAFPLMLLCFILLIVEIIIILIKRLNPLRFPLIFITMISNIIVIGFYFFWIFSYGIKPYYPFIYQPSELSNYFDPVNHLLEIFIIIAIIYLSLFTIKFIKNYKKKDLKNEPK
ncbi:MAG: hypothetical protein ACTSQO_02630 [Candidatus Helarchaeota archaeon]